MTKVERFEIGEFLVIPIGALAFGYARVLNLNYLAFYDYRTSVIDRDLKRIANNAVLFTILVDIVSMSEWQRLGRTAIEEPLTLPIVRFDQDLVDHRKCTIYDTAGMERDATPDECVGIEPGGVIYERKYAEERLVDALLRRPNRTAESFKVKLK